MRRGAAKVDGRPAEGASGRGTDHKTARRQIGAGENDEHEAEGEDQGAHHLDQARSVGLVPRRRLDHDIGGAGEGQHRSAEKGAHDDFVDAHVGLVGARPRGNLETFLWRVGIVHDSDGALLCVLHCGKVGVGGWSVAEVGGREGEGGRW